MELIVSIQLTVGDSWASRRRARLVSPVKKGLPGTMRQGSQEEAALIGSALAEVSFLGYREWRQEWDPQD